MGSEITYPSFVSLQCELNALDKGIGFLLPDGLLRDLPPLKSFGEHSQECHDTWMETRRQLAGVSSLRL